MDKQEYYVVMTVHDGSNIDEPWRVFKGMTFAILEEAQDVAEKEQQYHRDEVYQVGRVVPLDGDPEF